MTIQERVTELMGLAKEEGVTINPGSTDGLGKILYHGSIFLLDNGNYRIRWKFENIDFGVELTGDDHAVLIVHGHKMMKHE